MGKWFGQVGFAIDEEYEPGCHRDNIVEKSYYGEVMQNKQRNRSGQTINDNLTLSNRLKIVSEPFLMMNQPYIRYVTWRGARWSVSTITEEFPNLILDLGEVYNGDGPSEERS